MQQRAEIPLQQLGRDEADEVDESEAMWLRKGEVINKPGSPACASNLPGA